MSQTIESSFEYITKNPPLNKDLVYKIRITDFNFSKGITDNEREFVRVVMAELYENKENYIHLKNLTNNAWQGNKYLNIYKGTEKEKNFGFQIGFSANLSAFLREDKSRKELYSFLSQAKNNIFHEVMGIKRVKARTNFFNDLENEFSIFSKVLVNSNINYQKFDNKNLHHLELMDLYLSNSIGRSLQYEKSWFVDKDFNIKSLMGLSKNEQNEIRNKINITKSPKR